MAGEFSCRLFPRKIGVNNKNWNLFAGDIEYKTNCFLQFQVPFIFDRFMKDKLQRFRHLIRAFLCGLLIVWLLVCFVCKTLNFLQFFIVFLSLASSSYFYIYQQSNLYTRLFLCIVDHFTQTFLYSFLMPSSQIGFFALFNFQTFLAGKGVIN